MKKILIFLLIPLFSFSQERINSHSTSLQILLSLLDILDGSRQNGFFQILQSLLIAIQHTQVILIQESSSIQILMR